MRLQHPLPATAVALATALIATACGGGNASAVTDPAALRQACPGLAGLRIPAAQIGASARLDSGDATVTSATLVAARPLAMNASNTAVATPANPEYCEVKGSIAPVTAGAQSVGFQVNLPIAWNNKMAQLGGSGLNGSLVTATGYINTNTNAGSYDTPLNRGYLTAGTDSGHLTSASARSTATDPAVKQGADGDFALNDEMLRNFAHESYKKVHDTALQLSAKFYNAVPARVYYFGGSEGGREALTMAQRYPADYDGIFARSPVIHWTGLFSAFIRTGQNQLRNKGAAFLGTADVNLLYRTVLAACDGRDGVVDGVVSDYLACKPYADAAIHAKLCTGAYTAGQCFTQAQLDGIDVVHASTDLGFTLANGSTQYPGWLYGGETNSYAAWKTGKAANAGFGNANQSNDVRLGFNGALFFFAQDPTLDVVNAYDPANYRARIQAVSALMDSTNPDLGAFRGRNGKLVILDCTGDWAKSAQATFDYYDAVRAKLGTSAAADFLRLYVSPSAEHGCGNTVTTAGIGNNGVTTDGAQTSAGTSQGMPVNVDWVSVLENWVEKNQAPGSSVVATRNDPVAPFAATSSKPLCQYPLYPKFTGTDAAAAGSYGCVASGS